MTSPIEMLRSRYSDEGVEGGEREEERITIDEKEREGPEPIPVPTHLDDPSPCPDCSSPLWWLSRLDGDRPAPRCWVCQNPPLEYVGLRLAIITLPGGQLDWEASPAEGWMKQTG